MPASHTPEGSLPSPDDVPQLRHTAATMLPLKNVFEMLARATIATALAPTYTPARHATQSVIAVVEEVYS